MDIIIDAELAIPPKDCLRLANHHDIHINLLIALSYHADQIPLADLLRQCHALPGEWLLVSPIHWQVTHNDAMIVACEQQLQLSEREARLWFDVFAAYVAHEHMTVVFHHPYLWLLRVTDKPKITAKPVYHLIGASLSREIECIDRSHYWQRLMTEVQMLFSAHPLNTARQPYPINGVWLWGNGELSLSTRTIITDKNLINLARLVSHKVQFYHDDNKFSCDDILLLQSVTSDQLKGLRTSLHKQNVCWYWNNIAYSCKRLGWFSRLWRALCK
ncbi:MAG: hypothetical protein ACOVQX_06380 [Legionella sp.]